MPTIIEIQRRTMQSLEDQLKHWKAEAKQWKITAEGERAVAATYKRERDQYKDALEVREREVKRLEERLKVFSVKLGFDEGATGRVKVIKVDTTSSYYFMASQLEGRWFQAKGVAGRYIDFVPAIMLGNNTLVTTINCTYEEYKAPAKPKEFGHATGGPGMVRVDTVNTSTMLYGGRRHLEGRWFHGKAGTCTAGVNLTYRMELPYDDAGLELHERGYIPCTVTTWEDYSKGLPGHPDGGPGMARVIQAAKGWEQFKPCEGRWFHIEHSDKAGISVTYADRFFLDKVSSFPHQAIVCTYELYQPKTAPPHLDAGYIRVKAGVTPENKVPAIKTVREIGLHGGTGLKEAKQFIEGGLDYIGNQEQLNRLQAELWDKHSIELCKG